MKTSSDAQSQLGAGKSIHSIILDTSPILNNNPSISTLLASCEKLYTVPAILDEVRDANARSRLEITILPFLTVRTPKPESIKFISDFSRKTGDISVLSRPDIQILALAYELECEQNSGDWRLRRVPGQKELNGPPRSSPDTNLEKTCQTEPSSSEPPPSDVSHGSTKPSATSQDDPTSSLVEEANPTETAHALSQLQIAESDSRENSLQSNNEVDLGSTLSNSADPESESDDSEGWINPSNLKKQQAKDESACTVPKSKVQFMQVATITGDFAMQNVLLQIGLNLLSSSLQRIKTIRNYILRCHACFEKVKDMSKQFCPRCGKPTLTRVSCSTNQKGEFQIHLKRNMQWNHRGDRFSIPKPVPGAANGKVGQGRGGGKGGWGQELILAEDQKEYLRATSGRKGKKELDLMDDDYLPGILTGERARNGGRPKVGAGRNVNSKKRVS